MYVQMLRPNERAAAQGALVFLSINFFFLKCLDPTGAQRRKEASAKRVLRRITLLSCARRSTALLALLVKKVHQYKTVPLYARATAHHSARRSPTLLPLLVQKNKKRLNKRITLLSCARTSPTVI